MSLFGKMTNKMQETASITKLLASLKFEKTISTQIVEAYIKKDFTRLISIVDDVIKDEPVSRKSEVYTAFGGITLSSKSYEIAKSCLTKAIEASESNPKTYETLGSLYFETEEYDKATENLNLAISNQTNSENTYLLLIKIFKIQKKYTHLIDSIWKYLQKFNKTEWRWESDKYLFDNQTLHDNLNLHSPGTALCFLLREVLDNESPEDLIDLSVQLSSRPFPIFNDSLEQAAYHWLRAMSFTKLKQYSKTAEEWYTISNLPNIPEELVKLAIAEWKANELSGHFDPQILNNILNRDETAKQAQFIKSTILFCDVRGFSRFSFEFRHAPQVILQFLQPFNDQSQDIIANNNGILNAHLGDGFISQFIPDSQDEAAYEESVKRAFQAGIELQKYFILNLPGWCEIWKRNLDDTEHYHQIADNIGLGIGIHTGFAFIGEVGTEKRKVYTSLGNVVNFTARLQGKAASGRIVFSAPAYEYLKNINFGYEMTEMPEDEYTDLKNIPGSYRLYFIDCNKKNG